MKRSPLRRHTPLVARSQLRRKSGLRERSTRTETLYREERRPLVERLLRERRHCQAQVAGICTGLSVDVHEIVSRARGGSITDEANCVAVCRRCHEWIDAHPAEAHERGLLRHAWERPPTS